MMATVLHLDASPRPGSYSRALSSAFVDGVLAADPDARVIRRDLVLSPPPFMDEAWVQNAFLPPEARAPGALAVSDARSDEARALGTAIARERSAVLA